MLPDDLAQHPLYQLCTVKEQTLLQHYLKTKDLYTSVQEIYRPKNTSAFIRKLQRQDIMSSLLGMIVGNEMPTKDEVIKKVWRTVQTTKHSYHVLKGAEILSQINGWYVTPAKPAAVISPEDERIRKAKEIDG